MFKNPFSFNGRIRRTEYGVSYVIFIVFIFALAFFAGLVNLGGYQLWIILGGSYWFIVAQSAKRCHDLDNSGFYQLIPFYFFALIFSEGQKRTNKYGQDPKLVELQVGEDPSAKPLNKFSLPEDKSMEAAGSELLSGVMITVLAVALAGYFLDTSGLLYFIIESILIMAGYFTLLLLSSNRKPLPSLPIYFLVHRAVFSLGFYVVIYIYTMYSNNLNGVKFELIANDIMYLIAIFLLTYVPYFFYKTQKKSNLVPLEA